MKAFEVKKGEAKLGHGRVMMAIEGVDAAIRVANAELRTQFASCEYEEEGEREGETAFFFMIDRSSVEYFMTQWKAAKASAKQKQYTIRVEGHTQLWLTEKSDEDEDDDLPITTDPVEIAHYSFAEAVKVLNQAVAKYPTNRFKLEVASEASQ